MGLAERQFRPFGCNAGPTLLPFQRRTSESLQPRFDFRGPGVLEAEEIIWFWMGSHEDYDKLLP